MATTTAPLPPSADEPQASISPLGRIFGVLFSPKPTYEDIARKPSCLLPLALLAVLGAIVAVSLNQRMNWREFVLQQIEKNPSATNLSVEDKEKRAEVGARIAPYTTYFFGILAPPVLVLILAGILLGGYNVIGGAGTNYKTSLGIVAHAYVPLLIANVLFLVVLFLKPSGTLDLDNPVATNLAAFLPEGSPKWLEALGKNADIFILWITLLIALGFAATNPRKMKGATPYAIAFGLLGAWVVIRMGWAFIVS